jgi:hypothetical protein
MQESLHWQVFCIGGDEMMEQDITQSRLEAQIFGKQPEVLEYFSDESGNLQYNEKCMMCTKKCKQSYRAVVKYCPRFIQASL